MKRIALVIFVAITFAGCNKPEPFVVPTPNEVLLQRDYIEFYDVSGQWVSIITDGDWTASLDFGEGTGGWAMISKMSGSSDDMLRLTTTKNNTLAVRLVDLVVTFDDEVIRVTVTQDCEHIDVSIPNWRELPEVTTGEHLYFVKHFAVGTDGEPVRNYSMLYDGTTYIAYWVAYPLHSSYFGTGRTDAWTFDPLVPTGEQTNLKSGYGTEGATSPDGNVYNRGHQLASSDRNVNTALNAQTFYYTNMTPQIGTLNGGRWGNTETKLHNMVKNNTDTLWCVSGALIHTVTGAEAVIYIINKNDGKTLPVPNYYYKVAIMKNGDSYTGIGFWYNHTMLSGAPSRSDTKTIREIEVLTGYDFFCNLSEADQASAETTIDYSFWGM